MAQILNEYQQIIAIGSTTPTLTPVKDTNVRNNSGLKGEKMLLKGEMLIQSQYKQKMKEISLIMQW